MMKPLLMGIAAFAVTAAASTNGDQVVVFDRDGKVLARVRRRD